MATNTPRIVITAPRAEDFIELAVPSENELLLEAVTDWALEGFELDCTGFCYDKEGWVTTLLYPSDQDIGRREFLFDLMGSLLDETPHVQIEVVQ